MLLAADQITQLQLLPMLIYVQILTLPLVKIRKHAHFVNVLVECLFFSTTGGVSFIWWIFWNIFVYSSPETHPRIDPVEKNYIMKTVGAVAYEQVSLYRSVVGGV